jgi:hypothetical protein
VNHSLQNNDWITTIKTQVCLLENDQIFNKYEKEYGIDKSLLKQLITKTRIEATKNGYFMCALADYMVQLTLLINENKDKDQLLNMADLNDPSTLADFVTIVRRLTSFQVNSKEIEQFLKNWYKHASTLSLKDFPKTYEEFTQPDNITKEESLNKKLLSFITFLKSDKSSFIDNINKEVYNNSSEEQQKIIRVGALNSIFIGKVFNNINSPKSANIIFTDGDKTIIDLINTNRDSPIFISKSYTLAAQRSQKISKNGLKSLHLIYLNYIRNNKEIFGLGLYDLPQSFNHTNLINPK